ncbi:oligosaccharide flippase family protein [Chitinophaga sp. GbtcB8]|uniref:oligosaccharide flippase family protein n=1 Tax=Chitinophaga sp. GbtcB8 TaxID=2824753 RepID=UPI001C30718E|nr:oligosaccharide flippase family protein [Chitinophaga sp. GbtcB8]
MGIGGIKSVLANKNIRFIFFRYFVYLIQFGNSIFIAKYLGPYFFGIWGFILLVIQYLTQINFGIPYSLNVKLAGFEGKDDELQVAYLGNSLILVFLHSVLIILAAVTVSLFNIPIFHKFSFYPYIYLVAITSVVQNLDLVFICAYRIKNSLALITFYQAAMPISTLLVCFFWKGQSLLYALIFSQLISYLLSFIFFLVNSPIRLKFRSVFNIQKDLLKNGMALLLYNASFYFIMIVTRTFVGYYFSVKELGYFSFAVSLAQAVFLALDTISFLIFPKLVNRFKYKEGEELFKHVEYIRSYYSLVAYLLIFSFLLAFPVILIFTPQYYASYKPFALLSTSMALLSSSFGVSVLFISFGRELLLGKIALSALILNVIIGWVIATHTTIFYALCFAPLITYFIYSCLLTYFYGIVFLKKSGFKEMFSNLDVRLLLPTLVLLISIMMDNTIAQVLAYLLVILLNIRKVRSLVPIVRRIIHNPSLFKI